HHASALHELPILIVVMNNSMWGAVDRSTRAMYPDGLAAKSSAPPFVQLDKLPAFERICEAAGGYGERVDDPAALPGALQRAISVVNNEKRQALLNVTCGPGATAYPSSACVLDLPSRPPAIGPLGGKRCRSNQHQRRDRRRLLLPRVHAEHREHRQAGDQREPHDRGIGAG